METMISSKRDVDETEHPLFEHDCGECAYLGTYVHPRNGSGWEGTYDLYHHDDGSALCLRTVVARYSSFGPDYTSDFTFARQALEDGNKYHPLVVACRRAADRGLWLPEAITLALGGQWVGEG